MNDKDKLEFAKELDNCTKCRQSTIKSIKSFVFYHLRDHNLTADQCGVGVIPQGGNN